MLTLATRIKLAAFAVIAVAVIAYTAIHYADVARYAGLPGYYVVKVNLASGGGIFTNANVTYRGVSVGRVGAMRVHGSGIQADLDISDSAVKIPANVQVVVADLSAVGEQYVNLLPQTGTGPYLTSHSVISERSTQIPPNVTTMLQNSDNFVNSVPDKSLQTVVDELGKAFAGQGPNLQVLLDAASSFNQAAASDIPQTTSLINDGQTVLATQQAESQQLQSFGASAELFARQLATSDSDLRRLISAAPPAAEQVIGLLNDNTPSLGVVFANLLTSSEVAQTRGPALQELLSVLPADIAAGSTAINANGANFGMALTFFSPLPCTAGYGGTSYRNGLNTSAAPPLNTGASCTEPASAGDVRGSAHAPSGGGVPSAAKP